jgi:pimeloyl-ACP methyl ester carboxylesterase
VESRLRAVLSPMDEERWLNEIIPLLFGRAYREKNVGSMKAFARSRARNPADPVGIARQWEAFEAFDAWDRLPLIPHPTLVIAGDEDVLTLPANAERIADRMPHAEVAMVPGGHSVHIENPEAVNRRVEAFLRG